MKYKPLTATVDAYQLTKDYATDSPKWVRDRIGTRLFENTTIRDGAVHFDGLTSIIQNRKLRERMTARPGDYLVRMQDGNVAVYTKRNFEALFRSCPSTPRQRGSRHDYCFRCPRRAERQGPPAHRPNRGPCQHLHPKGNGHV